MAAVFSVGPGRLNVGAGWSLSQVVNELVASKKFQSRSQIALGVHPALGQTTA
jgi:hypothetical protein